MSSFKQVLESRNRVPSRHLVLTRNMFADTWEDKPTEDTAIGLRKIADADIQTARAEAAKFAIAMHDDREGQIDAFNDMLMRWMIIAGTCDANDFTRQAPFFESSEENVRNALTSQSIRYIWDQIDAFLVETSPLVPIASDEEILDVAERLLMGPLPAGMPKADQIRIRKLLGVVMREIQFHEPKEEDSDEEDENDDVPTQDDAEELSP